MDFLKRSLHSIALGVFMGILCALLVACVSAILFSVPHSYL